MTVGNQARVSLPNMGEYARLTWDHMRRTAGQRGKLHLLEGAPGLQVSTSLKSAALNAVPALNVLKGDALEAALSEIRIVLKSAGNAKCQDPNPKHPVWWVSDTYADPSLVVKKRSGDGEPDYRDKREARLTTHEAGEDREPAPVTTIYRSPRRVAAVPDPDAPLVSPHLHPAEKILELFTKFPDQPLATPEIAFALGDLKPPHAFNVGATVHVAGGSTVAALTKLVKAGKIFRRLEVFSERVLRAGLPEGDMPNGRCANLYSTTPGVACMRTVKDVIPGYVLAIGPLPKDPGVAHGARIREDRNAATLDFMLKQPRPATVNDLLESCGGLFTRSVLEDALKDLKVAGLLHHTPFRRGGRRWASIDVPLEEPKIVPAPAVVPPVSHPQVTSPVDRIVLEKLREARRPVTRNELHEMTGYSTSRIGDTMNNFPDRVRRIGTDGHGRYTYVWNDSTTPAAPSKESVMNDPAPVAPPKPAPSPIAQVAAHEHLKAIAISLGVELGDSAEVERLRAENAELLVRLERAQAKITALSTV